MAYGFMTIYWRDMIRFVRFKTLLVSSLLQPALWLAFFGIAMSSSFDSLMAGMPVPPGMHVIGYLTFMGTGIIAMTTLFTSLFGGIVILFDKNWGLMREILASPMNRNHIIFGIGLSGVTKSFIQALIIMGFGILIGAAFFEGFSAVGIIIGILGILAFVGMKMLLVSTYHVPNLVSLAIILGTLGAGILASIWATRRDARNGSGEPPV